LRVPKFLAASDLWHFSAAGLTSQEARRSPSLHIASSASHR
jgi:hypothetical protein